MSTTNDLPARLREHAAWRERLASPYDAKGAQWAQDLREAAAALERAASRPDHAQPDQAINMAVIEAAYGWTIDEGGALLGLVNGDMGYEDTGIRLVGEDLEIWRRGQSDKPSADQPQAGNGNVADRLSRILYGIGGMDAQMLHDAAAELERMRKAVLPEED